MADRVERCAEGSTFRCSTSADAEVRESFARELDELAATIRSGEADFDARLERDHFFSELGWRSTGFSGVEVMKIGTRVRISAAVRTGHQGHIRSSG